MPCGTGRTSGTKCTREGLDNMADACKRIHVLKKPDVTDLAGEKVMIDFETGKYFLLVGAANEIWDLLADGITVEEVVAKLMDQFEIEEDACRESTLSFLDKLREIGFISFE
jgi:hypothetical protein